MPSSAVFGEEGRGLAVVQHFFNENRIRQAASSLGAAQYCVDQAVAYAKERKPFGKPPATNQAIRFPLVELHTQCEMLRALIHKTAWSMDAYDTFAVSEQVSMCNYWANRLCCEAADRAIMSGVDVVVEDPARTGVAVLRDGRELGWAEWGPPDGRPVVFCPTPVVRCCGRMREILGELLA